MAASESPSRRLGAGTWAVIILALAILAAVLLMFVLPMVLSGFERQ